MSKKKLIVRVSAITVIGAILTILLQVMTNIMVMQTNIGKIISSLAFFFTIIMAIGDMANIMDKSETNCYDTYHKASCKRYLYMVVAIYIY